MTLTLHTTTEPPAYERGVLRPRTLRFYLDGWPLLAESLDEARREAELMGEADVADIEPEH